MPSQPISPSRATISARESVGPLVLVDDGRDLGLHEVADGVAEEDVLGREIEVHRPSVAPGRRPASDRGAPSGRPRTARRC